MRDYSSMLRMSPMIVFSLMSRGLSSSRQSLLPLVHEIGGSLLPSGLSSGPFFYFHSKASTDFGLSVEFGSRADILFVLALITYLLCDTAYNTLEIVTERLIAPFWHRVRKRRPARTTSSSGLSRSLRQWLCSPSRNEKNCRPTRFIQISHNPPPLPSLPACG